MAFNLALSSLPTGGCLDEVSSGSVPGQASFCGPHFTGVCCSVGHSCWVLPAALTKAACQSSYNMDSGVCIRISPPSAILYKLFTLTEP